jgi:hypothetical protein
MELVPSLVSTTILCIFIIHISSELQKKRINLKELNVLFHVVLLILALWGSFLLFNNFIRVFINFLILSFIFKNLFRETLIKSFVVSFVTMLFFFLAELLFGIILVIFLSKNALDIQPDCISSIIANACISLIAFLLFNITPLTSFSRRFIKKYARLKYSEVVFISIIAMGLLTNKNILLLGINMEYFINLLLIIVFAVIVIFFVKEKQIAMELYLKQEQLFKSLYKYEKELSDKRLVIHEFKNQLIVIKSMIEGKDKNINEYLNIIIEDVKKVEMKNLKGMENLPNGGLKGLIHYKLGELKEEKIAVFTNINDSVRRAKFSSLEATLYKDIVKIFGVFLDNAIEATTVSQKKQIVLEMYYKKGIFNFVLSNTFDDKININKISDIGHSTKGKGRGYGLYLVDKLIGNYDFIKEKKEIGKGLYTVHLTIDFKNALF